MEALNIRLDQMESIKIVSGAAQGMKNTVQGDTGFSTVLDKALNATEGVQKSTDTQPQTKPAESSGDESKLKQLVSEKDSGAEKTENASESKETHAEENVQNAEESALAAAEEDAEHAVEEPAFDEAELFAKLEETLFKDKDEKNTELPLTEVVIPFVPAEESAAETELASDADLKTAETSGKKQTKKAAKEEDAAVLVFSAASGAEAQESAAAELAAAGSDNAKPKANKNIDKPLFTVIDERTASGPEHKTGNGFVSAVQYDGNNAEMSLSLADKNTNSLTAAADVGAKRGAGESTFASMLSSEIKNNAGEFVKTGMITLRNNNSGTINLVLHPEELGNVKIKLELSDKLITGKIVVATEEAYGAFKNNIESLRQAFISSGFDNAGFELSWSGSGEGSGQHNGKENSKNPQGFLYSETMPMAAGAEDSAAGFYGMTSVNVVV